MGYPTCPPPYYSTFTTVPTPSPNLSVSHDHTPPSPNPYPSSPSYYIHPYSQPHPAPPYSQFQPPPPSSPPLPYSQPQPPPLYSGYYNNIHPYSQPVGVFSQPVSSFQNNSTHTVAFSNSLTPMASQPVQELLVAMQESVHEIRDSLLVLRDKIREEAQLSDSESLNPVEAPSLNDILVADSASEITDERKVMNPPSIPTPEKICLPSHKPSPPHTDITYSPHPPLSLACLVPSSLPVTTTRQPPPLMPPESALFTRNTGMHPNERFPRLEGSAVDSPEAVEDATEQNPTYTGSVTRTKSFTATALLFPRRMDAIPPQEPPDNHSSPTPPDRTLSTGPLPSSNLVILTATTPRHSAPPSEDSLREPQSHHQPAGPYEIPCPLDLQRTPAAPSEPLVSHSPYPKQSMPSDLHFLCEDKSQPSDQQRLDEAKSQPLTESTIHVHHSPPTTTRHMSISYDPDPQCVESQLSPACVYSKQNTRDAPAVHQLFYSGINSKFTINAHPFSSTLRPISTSYTFSLPFTAPISPISVKALKYSNVVLSRAFPCVFQQPAINPLMWQRPLNAPIFPLASQFHFSFWLNRNCPITFSNPNISYILLGQQIHLPSLNTELGRSFFGPVNDVDVVLFKQWDPGKKNLFYRQIFTTLRTRLVLMGYGMIGITLWALLDLMKLQAQFRMMASPHPLVMLGFLLPL